MRGSGTCSDPFVIDADLDLSLVDLSTDTDVESVFSDDVDPEEFWASFSTRRTLVLVPESSLELTPGRGATVTNTSLVPAGQSVSAYEQHRQGSSQHPVRYARRRHPPNVCLVVIFLDFRYAFMVIGFVIWFFGHRPF